MVPTGGAILDRFSPSRRSHRHHGKKFSLKEAPAINQPKAAEKPTNLRPPGRELRLRARPGSFSWQAEPSRLSKPNNP